VSYAVELNGITVKYGNLPVLEDINLKVKNKEFLGIIGPNGGGKTTLLKVILGLIEPVKGDVIICGSSSKKALNNIGYVPQISAFDRNFPIDVLDVVLTARLKGNINFFHHYKKKDINKAESILNKLDLYDLKDRQIGQLSGGQLQRVLIARALTMDPKILLLDEPTASVDTASTSAIYEILKDLNKEKTIIVVTHNLSAVSSYFDSLACLNRRLYHHGEKNLKQDITDKVFGCPVDLIAHGHPHRVFSPHREEVNND